MAEGIQSGFATVLAIMGSREHGMTDRAHTGDAGALMAEATANPNGSDAWRESPMQEKSQVEFEEQPADIWHRLGASIWAETGHGSDPFFFQSPSGGFSFCTGHRNFPALGRA